MSNLMSKKRKGLASWLLTLMLCATLLVGAGIGTAGQVYAGNTDGMPEDDPNFIRVGKTFNGIEANQIPEDFQINVGSYVLNKGINTGTSWQWKIDNAEAGSYKVSESNAEIDGYELTTNGLGAFEVVAADIGLKLVEEETTCSKTNWSVNEGTFFAASLTGNNGCVVFTEHSLSATQRKAVIDFIVNKGGVWRETVHFYSIDEQFESGNGFSFNGKTVTYNSVKKEMEIGATSNWQHVMSIKYDIKEAQNPDINIVNTYTKKATDVTINKKVLGNLGDVNKDFDFELQVLDMPKNWTLTEDKVNEGDTPEYELKNNGVDYYAFDLKNNEEVAIHDLPLDATLWLKETNAEGYAVTMKDGKGNPINMSADGWYRVKVSEGLKITVENKKDVAVDTGINLDSLPYILILVLVGAGATALILRKRFGHND